MLREHGIGCPFLQKYKPSYYIQQSRLEIKTSLKGVREKKSKLQLIFRKRLPKYPRFWRASQS